MARTTGCALLAGLAALVAVVSTAIFLGVGGTDVAARAGRGAMAAGSAHTAVPAAAGSWVGTWSASPVAGEPSTADGYPGWSIRNVVHTSVGGTWVRVHLSNTFGSAPLVVAHATVARSAGTGGAAAAGGTMRVLTFAQRGSVTIPAGGAVVSDPVRLAVPQRADLLVTTYAALPSGPVTYHPNARQISFMAHGERTAEVSGVSYTTRTLFWRYVSAVDVLSSHAAGAVVFFGDSITDGLTSTVGANHRWPDYLADGLMASGDRRLRLGVLNQGISGNGVLRGGPEGGPSALVRLDRDALSQTGARTMVVELGINDIIRPPRATGARAVIAGLRQIVARGHARGMRVIGGTLLPFEGHGAAYNPVTEAVRQQVNAAIRAGTVYDAVIDFDKALRDPYRPTRMRAAYDSGDHLHPSDAGYRRMAEAARPVLLGGTADAKA
ncbi:SGNH/GDSL hydrolase family protein [Streptomyces sp. MI02-7b]|uniref:SGNH/GDSL hydrolase family protein n=1 Tax=Streptomyces sp. MI02-7b TaxID=462941 RepID=UPI00299FC07D|nr:SGNH/GDSL hydrolase family protein [Streptomyces sp. MI02-7b]MDX3077260.1 SGNH/GDSL hydrolase family protein [Streptomyces sp. MI02-7b]